MLTPRCASIQRVPVKHIHHTLTCFPILLCICRVLVNDLDLRVHSAVETKVRWGNRWEKHAKNLYLNLSNVPGAFSEALTCRRMESVPEPGLDGDKKEMPDRINNHELVDVASPFSGVYTVTVLGHSIPEGPQCFALVFVLVSFSHSLLFFFTFLLTRFSSGEFLHGDAFQNDMRNDMRS